MSNRDALTNCLADQWDVEMADLCELRRETVPLISTATAYGELGAFGNSGTEPATDS